MSMQFRLLTAVDYPLFARWLAEEHVSKWWREPATVEHVEKEYGNKDGKTSVYLVSIENKPIGIIQCFRVEDYPDYAKLLQMPGAVCIDYLIGEPSYIGKGYGTKMIRVFIEQIIKPNYPDAIGVVTAPEVSNHASIAVLRKAGFIEAGIFKGEDGLEQRMKLRF